MRAPVHVLTGRLSLGSLVGSRHRSSAFLALLVLAVFFTGCASVNVVMLSTETFTPQTSHVEFLGDGGGGFEGVPGEGVDGVGVDAVPVRHDERDVIATGGDVGSRCGRFWRSHFTSAQPRQSDRSTEPSGPLVASKRHREADAG